MNEGRHEFSAGAVRQAYLVAGSGPVCVAHSGGPGLDAGYLRSAELEEHFTVVYVDPLGTGSSGPPAGRDDYRMTTYVRQLAAVVDHLGVGAVHLLGHSYGGYVAQTYALEHPERVAGLVLYSTSPQAGPDFWAQAMAGLASYPQRHPGVPEAAAVPGAFEQALQAEDDAELSRLFAAAVPVYFDDFWARRDEFEPWRAAIRMSAAPATAQDPDPFDLRGRLGKLTAPTVVIAGRADFMCGPGWAAQLAEEIPGAALRILEHSGHFAHVEQPAEFAAAAATLLKR